jgi:hypothetical protein
MTGMLEVKSARAVLAEKKKRESRGHQSSFNGHSINTARRSASDKTLH